MIRKDTRLLHVFGQECEHKIGRNTVAIYDSEDNRYFPKFDGIVPQVVLDKMIGKLEPLVREEACKIINAK